MYCGECGKPCHQDLVDFGIGPGEYWGTPFVDRNEQWVSDCCEATVFDDEELTIETDPPEPPEREYDNDDW